MSFSINSNTGSLQSNFSLNQNQNNLNKTLSALSSGDKLSSAATDAASLAISEKLLAFVSGSGQAIQNANDSIGLYQVADGGLSGIEDNTQRIRVLTLQASNDTLSSDDRVSIQKEIDGLSESSLDIANSTSFNGINLLDGAGGSEGNGTFVTQTGANSGETQSTTIGDIRPSIPTVNVTTQAGRDAALGNIDSGLVAISDTRATIASAQNSLISNIRNTSVGQINAASAVSQLRDVDFALESANFSRQNILAQTGAFAQAQSNASKSNLVGLLG
ncbi:Flagellin protein FlaA [hydrothermal vent metagenome]|uniref:Flagellin protein FlaA n=1 Tax=hydrothermal vent metagenome TaxID=652676 RepID=A0A1W1CCJ0_9ZZZZ